MIKFSLNHVKLRLDFSFFAALALFFMSDRAGSRAALLLCAAHEAAHLAAMTLFGIDVCSVTFYGAGIRITAGELHRAGFAAQAAVYGAGCAMNLMLAGVLFFSPPEAAVISMFMGCFNLLPAGEFDGAGLLRLFVIRYARAENADKIMRAAGIASVGVCAAAVFAVGGTVSVTLISTLVYLVLLMGMRC